MSGTRQTSRAAGHNLGYLLFVVARVFFAKDYYFTFLGLSVGGLSPWTTSETTSRHANVWAARRLQIAFDFFGGFTFL